MLIKDHPVLVNSINPASIVKRENVIGLLEKTSGIEQHGLPGNFPISWQISALCFACIDTIYMKEIFGPFKVY